MDNTEKPPAVLSLCSGYGGIERGLERVFGEINVLTHVEIEAFAIANLVNKMETGRMVPAPIWTDLKTFKAGLFRGLVGILTGGYPCQPFSTAGKRGGSEDPRHLWPYVRETIRACEPRWVFLENVEGHLSLGISEVLSDLENLGYKVTAGIFSAVEVGAPHQRKRVFILAHTTSKGFPQSPQRSECQTPGQSRLKYSCWPARPGEEQYEWEEPRVVGNPKADNKRGVLQSEHDGQRIEDRGSGRSRGAKTQPQLGRGADGTQDRIDRLRLLGNGVVPQTAEKAWRTLHSEIIT